MNDYHQKMICTNPILPSEQLKYLSNKLEFAHIKKPTFDLKLFNNNNKNLEKVRQEVIEDVTYLFVLTSSLKSPLIFLEYL